MTALLKRLLRAVLPARLHAALTRHRRLRFSGPYPTWAAARAASQGYDAPAILEGMAAAARAVNAGRAAYERDTVLFTDPAPDAGLVAELERATRAGHLRVLDFGGALGSSYHQQRPFLPDVKILEWRIVEQPHVAARGRAEFATAELSFHDSPDAALAAGPPDLVLLSSVLQYLEEPWPLLGRLAELPARTWVIARTPFSAVGLDAVAVQHVPPNLYPASYPAWIFSAAHFDRFWRERGGRLRWTSSEDGHFRTGGLAFDFRTLVVHSP